MHTNPPTFPVGPFAKVESVSDELRRRWVTDISQCPWELRNALEGLSESQLDTKYRNWTIRQIVHHIADSHLNSYVRFKWTLTEDCPTIKAYDEGRWSDLRESRSGSVAPSLLLVEGLHARWCQLLEGLTPAQYDRTFVHPESGETVALKAALAYYAWHGKHHIGQILWLRNENRT